MVETRPACKTRSGCVECKRRKVKCDEAKPICARCRSRSDLCLYEFRLSWTQGRPFKKRRRRSQYQPSKRLLGPTQHEYMPDTATHATSGLSQHNMPGATSDGLHVHGGNIDVEAPDFQISSAWPPVIEVLTSIPRSSKLSKTEDDLNTEHCMLSRGDLYTAPHNHFTTSPPQCLAGPNTLLSSESRFFMHHYCSQTAPVIFPMSGDSNPLRGGLLQVAFGTPHLLYALLASGARHYARLRGFVDEFTSMSVATFTHAALKGLRLAMNDPSQMHKKETVGTALALCTSDVISGNLDTWRIHLLGIHKLLLSALEHDKEMDRDIDSTWHFLIKWFETLDMFAGISGLRTSTVRHGQYRSARRAAYIDEFVGCSLELMPLLAKIGRLARKQTKHIERVYGTDDAERENSHNGLADDIQSTEKQIYSLLDRKVRPSFAQNPLNMTLAKDMENTHQAFIYASLLHLYRRVEQLPKNHIKPAHATYQIVGALQRIRPDSVANILVLWPVFTAGCETDDPSQRRILQERMQSMAAFGMGNVNSALQAMTKYWDAGGSERWDVFLDRHGHDIVLF